MRKYIPYIIWIIFLGVLLFIIDRSKHPDTPILPLPFKPKTTVTSLDSGSAPVSTERYFLVSYETELKNGYNKITGSNWFSCNGFPNKNDIDSIVYAGLECKKECYQHIVVLSIYEFKDVSDYLSFGDNYKSDPVPKKQKPCGDLSPITLDSTYMTIPMDSIIINVQPWWFAHPFDSSKQDDTSFEIINAKR